MLKATSPVCQCHWSLLGAIQVTLLMKCDLLTHTFTSLASQSEWYKSMTKAQQTAVDNQCIDVTHTSPPQQTPWRPDVAADSTQNITHIVGLQWQHVLRQSLMSHYAAVCVYLAWPVTESRRPAIRHCITHSLDTTGICCSAASSSVTALTRLSATITSTLPWQPVNNKHRHSALTVCENSLH